MDNIYFAPYNNARFITRPMYIDVLKAFRAENAPYRKGLRPLVEWLLKQTSLDTTLSAGEEPIVARIMYVGEVNVYDWYQQYEFYCAKIRKEKESLKAKKATKRSCIVGDEKGVEERYKEVAKQSETSGDTPRQISADDEKVADLSTTLEIDGEMVKVEYTIHLDLNSDKLRFEFTKKGSTEIVGSATINVDKGTFSTTGAVPIGFMEFLPRWVASMVS